MKIEVGDLVVHRRHGSARVVHKFVNTTGEILYQIDPSGLGYNGYYLAKIFAPIDELFVEVKESIKRIDDK